MVFTRVNDPGLPSSAQQQGMATEGWQPLQGLAQYKLPVRPLWGSP